MTSTIWLTSMNLDNITDDLLIVDFTEYHRKHPAEVLPSNGVMFIEQPDVRLASFCILNPHHLPYTAINLEKNSHLMTNESGEAVKQCECICRAKREEGCRWVMLLELKYCNENNISVNMQRALHELDVCYDFLLNKKHFFDDNSYRVYFCISHPEHETAEPFGRFICNQDLLLGLKDKGVNLLYSNAVKILTPEYLAKADVPHKYQYVR